MAEQEVKSGMQVMFDETTGSKNLLLQDKIGSKIIMDSSKGDITIEAKNNLIINKGVNGAARNGDNIKSTSAEDEIFWNWLEGFIKAINTWTPVPNDGGAALKLALTPFLANAPSELSGKIIQGSNKVKIGD
ncbi:hypothetical protein ACSAZL_10270 [Methanosarcina sp. T3]|uniref:hypothetical protein n=1 Tax=Methanosarcina sp. T3 TaxID=3439062 RepID=UPI003F87B2DC